MDNQAPPITPTIESQQPQAPIPEPELGTIPVPKSESAPVLMSFPKAMEAISQSKKIRKLSWGDVNDYGCLKEGWLTIFTRNNFHIWKVSDSDMEGDDWVIVNDL